MADDLVLLGVASDGSTDQWDGLKTRKGILLRWLQKSGLGFPDSGYTIWRARVTDPLKVELSPQLAGKKKDESPGRYVIESNLGFDITGSTLRVRPGEHVKLTFPDPAWYLEVTRSASASGAVRVEIFAGGRSRGVHTLSSGVPLKLRTRGIESVDLSVPGAAGTITQIRYGQLHDPTRQWTQLHHVCLPVSHPDYHCGSFTGTAEDQAKSRVPPAVAADWANRYSAGFNAIHPYLEGLALQQNPLFPQPVDPAQPKLGLDALTAVTLAAFDPHVARIVGLAWDDTTVAMHDQEWAYKISGRWGRPHLDVRLDSQAAWESIAEEVAINSAKPLEIRYGGVLVETDSTERANLVFSPPRDDITLTVGNVAGHAHTIPWRALNAAGAVLAQGVSGHSPEPERQIRVNVPGIRTIEFPSIVETKPMRLVLFRIVVGAVGFSEREAILPSIFATEPGPPAGPGWITASVEQPGGTTPEQADDQGPLQAALLWELSASEDGVFDEKAPMLHQVAGHQLSTNPLSPQPAAVPFAEQYLLNRFEPVLVPSELATVTDLRRRYYTDRGLTEGWRQWWARGIDLFGRVSQPSPPVITKLQDDAPPPPPAVLFAEYVQKDIPAQEASVLGRSPLGREWLAGNPAKNGAAVVFGWSPERVEQAPDVDGFRVYVRRPVAVTNPGPGDPEERYEGVPWGTARSEIGPVPVRFNGVVSSVATTLPNVTVTSVTPLDDTHASCSTDLSLDSGGGDLIGGSLTLGPDSYPIVGNGEGASISIAVEHAVNALPQPGTYAFEAGTSEILVVTTNIAAPALGGVAIRRRTSGVLDGIDSRLLVLGRNGGTFICRRPGTTAPAGNEAVSWYPAYSVVVADTGFGPLASSSDPVGNAQITVTSVRRWAGRQVESPPASPGYLTAVHATPPPTPIGDFIPSGLNCAEVATRADWYGVSRVTLTWQTATDLDYVVYRALGETVFKLDREAHKTTPHVFPQSVWPPELWANQSRRTAVQNDLAALDAVLASGTAEQIDAAYEGLRAGTQQLIAGQSVVEDAFAPRHSAPLRAGTFTDELDGKSRSHWFYRFAARSRSGLESGKSLSTPPICCPDVVAPAPPLGQLALADVGVVKLQWLISRERDLARYLVYRTATQADAADVRDMELVARVVPSPSATTAPGEVTPIAVPNKPWFEYRDPAPGGRDWMYRIVAVDTAGNASHPSVVLRGRALVPRPDPPVWDQPTRSASAVALSWTHPSDQRLTCLVERASGGGSFWLPVSGWLPRGKYSFQDSPPDLEAAWNYRVTVRDHLGQTAIEAPVVALPEVP
jgi:hypothetical protein